MIGCQTIENEIEETSGISYQLAPTFLYKNIPDFDKEKDQSLIHKDGDLKWASIAYKLSGSLDQWMKIDEVSGQNYLLWKPEFDISTLLDEKFYFMASVTKEDPVGRSKQVLSGVSFGTDEEAKTALITWDLTSRNAGN